MKRFFAAAVLTISAIVPAVALAQSSELTRDQVRDDLVQVEQAGYRPAANDIHYPADIQAAEARIADKQANGGTATEAYGPSFAGTSSSGPAVTGGTRTLFSKH
jgi:hypothetical protein